MNWLIRFFSSSIGTKLIMSLTGLFLCQFLLVHMIGNLQLFKSAEAFNTYAYFMTHNPLIKMASYGLYTMILVHALKGILIWLHNIQARGKGYAVETTTNSAWYARKMAILGSWVFIFIGVHMFNFWAKMHFDAEMPTVTYAGHEEPIKDLYAIVAEAFKNPILVVFYVLSMVVLAFHLMHGFQSAFRTLGVQHSKYTPLINVVGMIFSIVVPLAFAAMPVYFFLQNN